MWSDDEADVCVSDDDLVGDKRDGHIAGRHLVAGVERHADRDALVTPQPIEQSLQPCEPSNNLFAINSINAVNAIVDFLVINHAVLFFLG